MQRTTHKRLLSALLAIVMVVALTPLTVFAAPATAVALGHPTLGFSATLDADNPYLVNWNPSPDDPEGIHTAHFNAGTLTLKGYDGGYINSNGDIHIILVGENTVTVTDKLTAINSGDNILISGSGTLSIDLNYSPGSGHVNGIYASNGNVAIISGTVSIGVSTNDEGCGIRAADSITIGGVVNIDVTNTGNNKSYGLRANNDIIIESGELTVTAESTGDNCYGIYANGTNSLIANRGGIVDVNVKTGSAGGHSYGIYAYGNNSLISIEDGKTTLEVESVKGNSYGLYSFASDITVTDGEITLEVASVEQNSYGIYTNGNEEDITINGGQVTLIAESPQGDSYGIYAGNGSNVIIEDGVVDINVVANGTGIGIRAFNLGGDKGDVTISGGVVEINATTATDNNSHGISAAGTIRISTDEVLKIVTNGQALNKEPAVTLADYIITPEGAVFSALSITYTHKDYEPGSDSATYTVTFDANGGSGAMSPQTFTDGVAQELTTNAFTRTDYTFEGWATSSGGSVEYTDGELVTIAANTGLYAVWTPTVPTTYTFIETIEVLNITATTATIKGEMFDFGVGQVMRGFIYGSSLPLDENNNDGEVSEVVPVGASEFTLELTGLSPGTDYHVRAFVAGETGYAYGQILQFTTPGDTGNGDPDTGDPGNGDPDPGDPDPGDLDPGPDPEPGDTGNGDPGNGDPDPGDLDPDPEPEPADSGLDDVPKTGDGGGFPLWLGLMASGVLAGSLSMLRRRRPKRA
jgi:uncharacterized repeat protein (TIGR02543 family)/LPXTG-motif cell wall-anchored protein